MSRGPPAQLERFPGISVEMMEAVDKADAARFSLDEILQPKGWVLLSFLMDPRTGLGRFRTFRISNYNLMMELIDACTRLSVDEILELPDVQERIEVYREHDALAVEQIKRCSTVHDNLVVLGGHEAAGTCQIDNEKAATVLDELVGRITADG